MKTKIFTKHIHILNNGIEMNKIILFLPFIIFTLSGCATTSPPEPENRSLSAANKGLHFAVIGEAKKAIRQFSISLNSQDLSPKQRASILNNRGVAYKNSWEFAKAEQDFSEAIALHGDQTTLSWHNRGIVKYLLGDFTESAEDFSKFLTVPQSNQSPYPYLWRYLAQSRAGVAGIIELTKEADRLAKLPWPGAVVTFILGKIEEDELLTQAAQADGLEAQERLCDAYFFLGEKALLGKQKIAAIGWFEKAIATKMHHLNEYKGAEVELQRLTAKD